MLRFEDVLLRRGAFTLAANLTVARGGVTAIIGPSGGGKSTLLDAVAGFLAPQEGRIMWQDRDLTPLPPGDRPLAMLFQDQNLFPHLSMAQNVGLGLRPALRLTRSEQDRVSAAISAVGLEGMATRRPADLSGGQQSRAALARVLVSDAPLVLLDEPFAALGPGLRAEMLDLMAETLVGRTVLMVSHSPEDARRIARDALLVSDGIAHPPRPVGAFFDDPSRALCAYLGE